MWKLFFIGEIGSTPCIHLISMFFLEWVYLGDKQKAFGLELAAFPWTIIPSTSPYVSKGLWLPLLWPSITLQSPQGARADRS